MKKLLNIDGGGVRVYWSLLVLKYIENTTQKKIIDLFDYFTGVSASSIVMGCLLTKYSLDELINLFDQITNKIFYRTYTESLLSLNGLVDSKYSDYYIEQEFKKIYEDMELSQVKKPLTLLSYDILSDTPISFESWNSETSNIKLWQAIRGSTAAPTFFPPFVYNNHMLIDGGILSNNLSEFTYQSAKKYYGQGEQFLHVSIGTGRFLPKINHKPTGLLDWTGLFGMLFSASANYQMYRLLNKPKISNEPGFHRFDFNLQEEICLDDYKSMDKLKGFFNDWICDNAEKLDEICKELIK